MEFLKLSENAQDKPIPAEKTDKHLDLVKNWQLLVISNPMKIHKGPTGILIFSVRNPILKSMN